MCQKIEIVNTLENSKRAKMARSKSGIGSLKTNGAKALVAFLSNLVQIWWEPPPPPQLSTVLAEFVYSFESLFHEQDHLLIEVDLIDNDKRT